MPDSPLFVELVRRAGGSPSRQIYRELRTIDAAEEARDVQLVSLCPDDLDLIERDPPGSPGDSVGSIRDEAGEVGKDDEVAIRDSEDVGDWKRIDLACLRRIVG